MKARSVITALLGAALLCSAGGCSITDLSREEMLRPPKTIGDEAEIEKLISNTAKGGYTLKYPKSGSYRSAIVMHDLNSDGIDEAIAFFRDKDGAAGVHMLVMSEEDGKWQTSGDFVTETSDVDCVDFSDINGNGTQEILVGYATYTLGMNFLSAYNFDKGKTYAIESGQTYSAFYCGNLDGSGKNEVMTLSLFSTENEAKATLLEYDEERTRLAAKAEAPMDPSIVSYKNVAFSDLNDNTKGLTIDGALSNGELNTQLIYYDRQQNALLNPLYREKTPNPTQRAEAIYSADLGGDMKVEIPTVSALPFNNKSGGSSAALQVIWNSFDTTEGVLIPVMRTAVNCARGYMIKLPEAWVSGSFTALLNESADVMSVCEWSKGSAAQKLFDVKVFKVADWEQGNGIENYSLIYKDNRFAYAFINYYPESELAVADDEIKTGFLLLSGATVTAGNKL